MSSTARTNELPSKSLADDAQWKTSLKKAYRDPLELLAQLKLKPDEVAIELDAKFPCLVPREFASKMTPGDMHDPLLRQVLPLAVEREDAANFTDDPNEESAFMTTPGLIQKYAHRALLIVTGGCAVNCRYCFRRNFPYQGSVGTARLNTALAEIAESSDISEVILSGGDPLVLDDDHLGALIAEIAGIKHVNRLRIHTRFPIMIPSRLTPALRDCLANTRLNIALVLHINHGNELDADLIARLKDFHSAGVNLLNQSVLLKGVNDDAKTLIALSEKLFEARIIPYYLHRLDQVSGSQHYAVPLETAHALEQTLRNELPGYLVPKFVEEIPNAAAKTPLHLL